MENLRMKMKAKRSALSLVGISYTVFLAILLKQNCCNRVLAYLKEHKLVLFIEQLFEHKFKRNIFKIMLDIFKRTQKKLLHIKSDYINLDLVILLWQHIGT